MGVTPASDLVGNNSIGLDNSFCSLSKRDGSMGHGGDGWVPFFLALITAWGLGGHGGGSGLFFFFWYTGGVGRCITHG